MATKRFCDWCDREVGPVGAGVVVAWYTLRIFESGADHSPKWAWEVCQDCNNGVVRLKKDTVLLSRRVGQTVTPR